MKKRIFTNMFLIALLITLFTSTFVIYIMYDDLLEQMEEQITIQALYISDTLNYIGDEHITEIPSYKIHNRVTLIKSDGEILFDNVSDPAEMENHLDRPEIKEAIEDGYGEEKRLSKTLSTQTINIALKLDSGNFIRVSDSMNSLYMVILGNLPYIIGISIAGLFISLLIANMQTKKIVEPINQLNLKEPLNNDIYDELAPLLLRLEKQNKEIDKKIEEVEEEKRKLITITDNMNEGIIFLDLEEKVININKKAKELFFIEEYEEYINQPMIILERSIRLQNIIKNASIGKESSVEININNRDCIAYASPVLLNDGIIGTILLFVDK